MFKGKIQTYAQFRQGNLRRKKVLKSILNNCFILEQKLESNLKRHATTVSKKFALAKYLLNLFDKFEFVQF